MPFSLRLICGVPTISRLEQRHGLEPGPLAVDDVAAGLHAGRRELLGDIIDHRRLDRASPVPRPWKASDDNCLVDLRQALRC